MSKGNLFLGQARGSVGDVTFTHVSGVQVARARNRAPRNPQSVLQMVTRIVQASASKAYSLFLPICDHSFQGKATGTPNQSRFMQLNTAMLRDKLSDVILTPTDEQALSSSAFNFNYKGDQLPVFNDYIVSSGTLPVVPVEYHDANHQFSFGPAFSQDSPLSITYADMATALNAQQGDQVTFLAIANDPGKVGDFSPTIDAFEYARIILDPANGNMSAPFLTQDETTNAIMVNFPNGRNEGSLTFSFSGGFLSVGSLGTLRGNSAYGTSRWIQGLAVILSRRVGENWERSSQAFVLVSGADALNYGTFSEAYASYLRAERASALYLNQSGLRAAVTTQGGALEFVTLSNTVHVPASNGIVPGATYGGGLVFFYSAETTPSRSDSVIANTGQDTIAQLESMGYNVVSIANISGLDESAVVPALTAINNWFNPHTSFGPTVRP